MRIVLIILIVYLEPHRPPNLAEPHHNMRGPRIQRVAEEHEQSAEEEQRDEGHARDDGERVPVVGAVPVHIQILYLYREVACEEADG